MQQDKLPSAPLALAQYWWKLLLQPGDAVFDGTCGNGHDTLFLAQKVLTSSSGVVWAMDVQDKAIANTRERLTASLSPELLERVLLIKASHATLPREITDIKLAVFNLGYLPGGDKSVTTMSESTLSCLSQLLPLINKAGMITVTCYSGHPQGAMEQQSVIDWASALSKQEWNVCLHQWINMNKAPALLLIKRNS